MPKKARAGKSPHPKSAQLTLPTFHWSKSLAFGGSKLKSHPKGPRALSTKLPIHLVLRSTQARGERSFLLCARKIEKLVFHQAQEFGVKIYEWANAGNHLHLIVRLHSRRTYKGFVRSISGLLARLVLKTERGTGRRPNSKLSTNFLKSIKADRMGSEITRESATKFWDARPFTRLVSWGCDYLSLKNYLMINRIEMLGLDRLSAREMLSKIKDLQASQKLAPAGFY